MSLVNIISAIGNNSSIYPLIVRDCGIEVPTKIAMTYNQNKEDKKIAWLGARERFIDEYAVSAVWLGGIPLIDKLSGRLIKKVKNIGLNSDVNLKLISDEEKYYKKLKSGKKIGEIYQGFEYNIKKFRNIPEAQQAVEDMIKVKNNKKLFEGLMNTKFLASIAIPIALMGFVIPKFVFASSARKKQKYLQEHPEANFANLTFGGKDFDQFIRGREKMTNFQGALTSVLTNVTTNSLPAKSMLKQTPLKYRSEAIDAVLTGYHSAFFVAACFALVALILTFFLKKGNNARQVNLNKKGATK